MSAARAQLQQAMQFLQDSRLNEAQSLCRTIIDTFPGEVEAYRLMAASSFFLKQPLDAVEMLKKALAIDPDNAAVHDNLSSTYRALNMLEEAEHSARRALAIKANFPSAANNLALALHDQKRFLEAEQCARQALHLQGDYAEAANTLASALIGQERYTEALQACDFAIHLNPNYAEAHGNRALVLLKQEYYLAAAEAIQRALALLPDNAAILANRSVIAGALSDYALTLHKEGKLGKAIQHYELALVLQPDHAAASNNLGRVLMEMGMLDEALEKFRFSLDIQPDFPMGHGNLLFCLNYKPGITPMELAAAHKVWDDRNGAKLRENWLPHANVPDPDRRLRIGIVSTDLHSHPVGYFLILALEALNRDQFALVAYADRRPKSEMTNRLKACMTLWRDTEDLSYNDLLKQIRTDGIDILIDLNGHTGNNRLLVFGCKPAPVQISWIGYPGSTGLSAIDYFIADPYMVPEGLEQYYQGQVLRLPDCFNTFDAPDFAPAVNALPAQRLGEVLFGSFNNLAKFNLEVVKTWAEILQRLPKARLLLKYRAFTEPRSRHYFLEQFARLGITADRLELQEHSPLAEMFDEYQRVDIALDPFPFTGGMTTCLALWMGVPVITLPGETFASRQSGSFLTCIGVPELITHSREDYIERAVNLANDLPRLSALRSTLRPRMAKSPLRDGPKQARHLEGLLRGAWRNWCATQGAAS